MAKVKPHDTNQVRFVSAKAAWSTWSSHYHSHDTVYTTTTTDDDKYMTLQGRRGYSLARPKNSQAQIKPRSKTTRMLTVGQLHVDVPGRVGHDDGELAQHRHVEFPQVALHPL